MSKEKQIEEMAKAMCGNGKLNGNCVMDDEPCNLECVYGHCAARLHAKGYRKADEVAREIFEEMDILGTYNPTLYAEFKNKYTVGKKKCPNCKHFVGCETACGGTPCDLYDEGDEK